MIRNKTLLLTIISSLGLSGCTGLGIATGAAAVTGISAAQEGGIPRAVNDTKIKLKINEAWFQYDVNAFRKLSTTVNQGRVLLTGVVQNPEHRVEAVRLVWRVPEVQQVINEIRVTDSNGITGFIKDKWITSRLRSALTFDRGVQSINYSIDTVQSVIYLMGVAQNQAELNRVIEKARTISGVKQVVSYVKLAGEPLAGEEKEAPITQQHISAQPETMPATNISNSTKNYGPIVSESDRQTVTENIDVPAHNSTANNTPIEDQYYN